MGTTRLFYARAVLAEAKFERGPEYEQALVAVMTGEDSCAAWNPMDTTRQGAGITPYNSFGPANTYHVWNFAAAGEGVATTVATLLQENMAAFADALRTQGKTAVELCQAFSETPWGGVGDALPGQIVADWNDKSRDYVLDRSRHVFGTGPWPFQSSGERQG